MNPFLLFAILAFPSAAEKAAPEGASPWWRQLDDVLLTRAVETALRENHDLVATRARLDALQASTWQALSPTLPTLSFDVSGNLSPYNSLGFQFGGLSAFGASTSTQPVPLAAQLQQMAQTEPPLVFGTGSALLGARVQLDPGRSWSAFTAQEREADASDADGDAQSLALALQVARTYHELVGTRAQVQLLERQVLLNREVLSMIDARFDAGEAQGLDVLQQRQNLAAVETLLPSTVAQAQVLAQQLAILAGSPPNAQVEVRDHLPLELKAPSAPELETLLAQRPDVQAAAERVGAAEARLRAAWLAFLPSLGVSAQAGQQANWIREPNAQFVWGVGANLSVPLFGGGQRISQLRQASSQAAAAAASLRQVKLRVAQGIAGAQARFDGAAAQREAARTQRVAANLALDVARERYAAGLANYQAVQIALNTSLQSELTVLASERQVIDATLVLYDAISGPWAASILDVYEGNAP